MPNDPQYARVGETFVSPNAPDGDHGHDGWTSVEFDNYPTTSLAGSSFSLPDRQVFALATQLQERILSFASPASASPVGMFLRADTTNVAGAMCAWLGCHADAHYRVKWVDPDFRMIYSHAYPCEAHVGITVAKVFDGYHPHDISVEHIEPVPHADPHPQ